MLFMYQKKKKWSRPLLIRLVRPQREERVLASCKILSGPQILGPLETNTTCTETTCDDPCSQIEAS